MEYLADQRDLEKHEDMELRVIRVEFVDGTSIYMLDSESEVMLLDKFKVLRRIFKNCLI